MKADDITYVFEGAKGYAIHEGRVIAASDDLEQLESQVEAYTAEEPVPVTSSEIVTPNGVRGKVLGKVSGVWEDEVTVRLENGNIVHLPVSSVKIAAVTEDATSPKPIEVLEDNLATRDVVGRISLEDRYRELGAIKERSAAIICEGASDRDLERLDQIVVTADLEQQEVSDALTYLDEAEPFEAPAPFAMQAVEQESVGGYDGSWLADVTDQMIADAESTDYGKLMDEGPEALTAELPDVALADSGVTREMASSLVSEKTAGTDPEVREEYIKTFLARVEDCRRVELSQRQAKIQKEEAAQEDEFTDLPDDALFL